MIIGQNIYRLISKLDCGGDMGADPGSDGRGSTAGLSDRGGQAGGTGGSDGNAGHSNAGPLGGRGTFDRGQLLTGASSVNSGDPTSRGFGGTLAGGGLGEGPGGGNPADRGSGFSDFGQQSGFGFGDGLGSDADFAGITTDVETNLAQDAVKGVMSNAAITAFLSLFALGPLDAVTTPLSIEFNMNLARQGLVDKLGPRGALAFDDAHDAYLSSLSDTDTSSGGPAGNIELYGSLIDDWTQSASNNPNMNSFLNANGFNTQAATNSGNQVNSNIGGDMDELINNYKYDENSRQIWEDYVNSSYDVALEEFRNKSNTLNRETDKANKRIDRYGRQVETDRGELEESLLGATDLQNNLLTKQIAGMESPDNYNRLSFQIGAPGQIHSFLPTASRNVLSDIAGRGQQRFDNTSESSGSIFDAGLDTSKFRGDVAQQQLGNSTRAATFGNANLNYLDYLSKMAGKENTIIGTDKGLTMDNNQFNQQLEANEPGALEYLKGGASVLDTGMDLWNLGKSFIG